MSSSFFQQGKTTLKVFLSLVLMVVFFLFLLYFLLSQNFFHLSQKSKSPQQINNKLRLEKHKKPKVILPKVLYNLAGRVLKKQNNVLLLEVNIPQLEKEGSVSYKIEQREVVVGENTKIVRPVLTTQKKTNKRIIQEIPLMLKDIRVGASVEVLSNQNLLTTKNFEATKIKILPSH